MSRALTAQLPRYTACTQALSGVHMAFAQLLYPVAMFAHLCCRQHSLAHALMRCSRHSRTVQGWSCLMMCAAQIGRMVPLPCSCKLMRLCRVKSEPY